MTTDGAKYQHLQEIFGLNFDVGKHEFNVACEFCGRELRGHLIISRKKTAYGIALNGEFHHRDGNPNNNSSSNLQLLCWVCHDRFHDWGVIQRWLDEIGKHIEDLPDARCLKRIVKRPIY